MSEWSSCWWLKFLIKNHRQIASGDINAFSFVYLDTGRDTAQQKHTK